ncbi:MAG: hypothetical protein Ct9H300mP23_01150 [Nitrospinota bacterium]|nr:MAG: hypothetical protein Ct9H300mP23_01150 [Nitrospinota bacterium]
MPVINTPLAIQPDNIEMSFMLNTGMIMLHAENQQDFYDFPLAAIMASEQVDVTLPALFCGWFFLHHARGPVRYPEEYKLPLVMDGAPRPAMDNENPLRVFPEMPQSRKQLH